MSFEDTRWDIEQTVIKPLRDFRQQVAPLNQLHNDCVNQFATIMGGLLTGSDGDTAFQGQGSMAMADLVGRFLDGEEKLCGSTNELMGRLLDAATICEKRAQELEQRLNEIAIERDHTVEMLSGAALTMDGGAALQGGVDVPWDLIALGLTGVAAIAAATHNVDQARAQDAETARGLEIRLWENDMESGPNTEPLNRLPPDPKGPSGDSGDFLRMVGITIGATGVVLAAGAIIVNLSPAQEDLAQRLHNDYGSSGLSLDDIRAIIAKYPNLSEKQLRELLDQYGKVTSTHPNLVNTAGGSLQLFLLFIQLAYDPAKISPKQKLAKGIHEAEVILGVAEQGNLRWPLKRDPSGDAEVIDGNNQAWDVKGYVSGVKPPFNLADVLRQIQGELFVAHENVILDVSRLSPTDAQDLYRAIQKQGWGGKILWWPASPTP